MDGRRFWASGISGDKVYFSLQNVSLKSATFAIAALPVSTGPMK